MALARQFEGDGGCAHYLILTYFNNCQPICPDPEGIWGVRSSILTPQHVPTFLGTRYLTPERGELFIYRHHGCRPSLRPTLHEWLQYLLQQVKHTALGPLQNQLIQDQLRSCRSQQMDPKQDCSPLLPC